MYVHRCEHKGRIQAFVEKFNGQNDFKQLYFILSLLLQEHYWSTVCPKMAQNLFCGSISRNSTKIVALIRYDTDVIIYKKKYQAL